MLIKFRRAEMGSVLKITNKSENGVKYSIEDKMSDENKCVY